MYDEMEMAWKEEVVVYFNVLFHYLATLSGLGKGKGKEFRTEI
jgi:hypothetical protein